MNGPGNLDIAPDGSVYVPDLSNNRVDVFSAQGEFRFAFGRSVSPGGGDLCTAASGCIAGVSSAAAGAIARPTQLAIGPGGEVYVSGLVNNRVDVFSAQGEFRFAFGKGVNPGGGNTCTVVSGCQAGIADSSAGSVRQPPLVVDSTGTIYAGGSGRIDVFSPAGEFQFAFGAAVNRQPGNPNICTTASGCRAGAVDSGAGAFSVGDVDLLANGELAILDPLNNRVDVFSAQGEFRFAFGRGVNPDGGNVCTLASRCRAGGGGVAAGEVSAPANAIAADPAGLLYISNSQPNERVDVFTVGGDFVRAFGAGVIDGQDIFEVCTIATGCRAGLRSSVPGATGVPEGIAVDGSGAVYVAESGLASRVERFGELPADPGPAPAGPPSGRPAPVSNRFTFGRLKLDLRKGTATLTVAVPGSGSLALGGKGIRAARTGARGAGSVRLPIRLTGKAAKGLARTGKSTVRALVTFAPAGGKPATQARSLTLKKKLAP